MHIHFNARAATLPPLCRRPPSLPLSRAQERIFGRPDVVKPARDLFVRAKNRPNEDEHSTLNFHQMVSAAPAPSSAARLLPARRRPVPAAWTFAVRVVRARALPQADTRAGLHR